MTDRDPMRSLDDIEVPDRWDQIVRRAERADVDSARGPLRRGRILVAAALVLVAASVAAVIVRTGERDGSDERVASGPGAVAPPVAPPTIWGRTFDVSSVVIDGELQPLGAFGIEQPVLLHFDDSALTWTDHCIRRIDLVAAGDTIEATAVDEHPAMDCVPGPHYEVRDLLTSGPVTVELDGWTIALVRGTSRIEGVDVAAPTDDDAAVAARFWGKRWRVTSATATDGSAPADVDALVLIDATVPGRITASTCGSPWGLFEVERSTLTMRGGWHEEMVRCVGPLASGQAVDLVLMEGPSVQIDDDRLELRSPSGVVEAVRHAAEDPRKFFGHRWVVTEIFDGDDTLRFDDHDHNPDAPVIETQRDPLAVEVSGCARIGGTVDLVNGKLIPVEPWPTSEPLCHESLVRQDEWFSTFLGQRPLVAVVGDEATLRTTDAEVRLWRSD